MVGCVEEFPVLYIVYLINNHHKIHIVKGCRLRFIYMYMEDPLSPRLSSSLSIQLSTEGFVTGNLGGAKETQVITDKVYTNPVHN